MRQTTKSSRHAAALAALLATTVVQAVVWAGDGYHIDRHSIDGGVGAVSGNSFSLWGTIGQPDAGVANGGTFSIVGGLHGIAIDGAGDCVDAAGCADAQNDGIRDDNCVWSACNGGMCLDIPLAQFADMGGAFGACPPDTFANIHDKNHALNCFSGVNVCDPINIDAGGPFGACSADGFCNIHDANHALSVFAGTSTCSCPSGPLPEFEPEVWSEATVQIVPRWRAVHRDDRIVVDVFLNRAALALRSYQLHLQVTGGKSGQLKLVDIHIDDRRDGPFEGRADVFEAFNVSTGQMLSGLDDAEGAIAHGRVYLATFVYEAPRAARGEFVVDLADGDQAQSYLVAPQDGQIVIAGTKPAVVQISERW
jgi:hypothetical protein